MWAIILRRANGRYVRQLGRPFRSKYAAKQEIEQYEDKYADMKLIRSLITLWLVITALTIVVWLLVIVLIVAANRGT